ncbi:MAG: DUF4159 domain-containing protein [Pseudomonadota bacterium]
MSIGSLVFLNPWLLAGLLALPVLWWLLRAVPPTPKSETFAGVRLLLGLEDEDRQTDKTPWWLLLLRILAVAAAITGFSQPVLNLAERLGGGSGPLLLIMDQGWASAPDWAERKAAARAVLEEAREADREVVFWRAADGDAPPLVSAVEALSTLDATGPMPWAPDHGAVVEYLTRIVVALNDTVWITDGIQHERTAELLRALEDLGSLRIISPEAPALALTPPRLEDGTLVADVLSVEGSADGKSVVALAEALEGGERRIAVAQATTGEDGVARVVFEMPQQLRGTVTRIMLAERASAGGAAFADGAIRRIDIGLVVPEGATTVTTLTSPTHYLEKALIPWGDVTRLDVLAAIDRQPGMIILSDHGNLPDEERAALEAWVEAGGLLLRFAGPRLAASIGAQGFGSTAGNDQLLPVELRRGGRVLGGALAWSTPRNLGPFSPDSPFRGLPANAEVNVRTQVLAEPSPDLADRVWASLDDGTPLVTAASRGDGTVILFHVSSDAEWSSLPLSGLFVEMLGRLTALAPGRGAGAPDPEALAGTLWRADLTLGADGIPLPAAGTEEAVAGERLLEGVGKGLPPGVYNRADQGSRVPGEAESLVVNLFETGDQLVAFPQIGAATVTETLTGNEPERYGPWLLALAAVLIAVDVLGTLIVSGRLNAGARTAAIAILVLFLSGPETALAQEPDDIAPEAVPATAETTLGYVLTGDGRIDRVSHRAMIGLGNALTRRTAVEPGPPIGIRPGEDEIGFYPVVYWPLMAETVPDRDGLAALAEYLRGGGMLIIDTQNGASGFGGASAVQMREIARVLNLPPLEPVDDEHVLTRAFYLLADFPGRWRGGRVWAEVAPTRPEGVPENADIPQFDRVDDNVSPVVVGSADWASAWAVDERGAPLFPIGRPGDRQREMAIRFGVNVVMYALTGNYKSDQVHAPAVLERLGQ